jgi:protein-disulfide isomerase
VNEAIKQLGLTLDVEIIADLQLMREFGLESTPAVALEGKLLLQGRTPPLKDMITLLEKSVAELKDH